MGVTTGCGAKEVAVAWSVAGATLGATSTTGRAARRAIDGPATGADATAGRYGETGVVAGDAPSGAYGAAGAGEDVADGEDDLAAGERPVIRRISPRSPPTVGASTGAVADAWEATACARSDVGWRAIVGRVAAVGAAGASAVTVWRASGGAAAGGGPGVADGVRAIRG